MAKITVKDTVVTVVKIEDNGLCLFDRHCKVQNF